MYPAALTLFFQVSLCTLEFNVLRGFCLLHLSWIPTAAPSREKSSDVTRCSLFALLFCTWVFRRILNWGLAPWHPASNTVIVFHRFREVFHAHTPGALPVLSDPRTFEVQNSSLMAAQRVSSLILHVRGSTFSRCLGRPVFLGLILLPRRVALAPGAYLSPSTQRRYHTPLWVLIFFSNFIQLLLLLLLCVYVCALMHVVHG